jgi:hypothetical protein
VFSWVFIMNKQVQRGLILAGVLGTVSSASFAAVDAAVTGAMTSAGTDGLAYVGALAVAAAGFILIKKVLQKLGINF